MKRPMFITVTDKTGQDWLFRFRGDPAYLEEWRNHGLRVEVAETTVPAWAAGTPLAFVISKIESAWQWVRLW